MKVQTYILLALMIFALPISARSQQASTAKASVAAGHVLSDESFTKGIDAMYNLDFEDARKRFEDVRQRFPDHPAGPYYLAANLFLRTLTKPGRLLPLLTSLSGSKTFGANADKVDAETVRHFQDLRKQGNALAKARLKHNSGDKEALYFLGAMDGLSAAFKGTLEGNVVGAVREGSSGVDKHRDLLKVDPNFHDAELSIGVHDYTVGALPPPIKMLAAIVNVRGSKKRGLETLERVGREGHLERYVSKLILIVLYKREKRYTVALERARELTAKYPRSYLFKLAEADALTLQAAVSQRADPEAAARMEREAFAIFDSMLSRWTAQQAPVPPPLDLIHFIYGENLLRAGLAERAAREFLAAASASNAEAPIITIARLRSAQAFDLAGKRREALAGYDIVMKRPNVYRSHERAAQGLRKPYKE